MNNGEKLRLQVLNQGSQGSKGKGYIEYGRRNTGKHDNSQTGGFATKRGLVHDQKNGGCRQAVRQYARHRFAWREQVGARFAYRPAGLDGVPGAGNNRHAPQSCRKFHNL